MPNRKPEHGLFVEWGTFRAGAFGWIGIIGLVVLAIGFGASRYLGLW
jgi:hypothetical protein